ncbi:GrpB family protein [Sporosarcina saromensis]|uniref:GrpB family protein n=1 Tax=Sporosarcina saromensis TaxID=359365 RepID=A0ABU4GE55_9BACL|nr:GrpB family protein [Sporosarcina saromensis]MDW0115265.1 GrpB family protein [Sporosarcina saromensis]
MLGLNKDEVTLLPHEPKWKMLFEQEKKLLQSLIGKHIVDIQHIGSTAIANIAAKPMLDVLIGVEKLEDVKKFDKYQLKDAAIYQLRAEVEGKVVFAKFADLEALTKTHVYHIVEYGGDWWLQHTLFRDYLNKYPETAVEYERLKKELATKYPTNERSYADAKKEFVDVIHQKAMKELSVK